jgi:hypothetical protein
MKKIGIAFPMLWLCFLGCSDAREGHLENFLSGSKKAPSAAEAEAIQAEAMASDVNISDRVHQMEFGEVAERLGAHRFKSKITFEFTKGTEKTGLSEEDWIVLASNGDFRVKVENDAGDGYELLFAQGHFYVKRRYGPFHEQSILTGDPVRWRNQAHGGLAAIYRLYRGRLVFSKLGAAKYQGRDALRFSVALGKEPPRLPGTKPAPEVPEGVAKYVYPIRPTPADKDRYRDEIRPVLAQGSVLVDVKTGVLLQADLSGRFQMSKEVPVELSVSAHVETDGFGNPPSLDPPGKGEVKPIPEREVVDTKPLDPLFGKGFTSTLGPPAGVAAVPEDKRIKEDALKPTEGGSTSNP